jgi:hypothetical protein
VLAGLRPEWVWAVVFLQVVVVTGKRFVHPILDLVMIPEPQGVVAAVQWLTPAQIPDSQFDPVVVDPLSLQATRAAGIVRQFVVLLRVALEDQPKAKFWTLRNQR